MGHYGVNMKWLLNEFVRIQADEMRDYLKAASGGLQMQFDALSDRIEERAMAMDEEAAEEFKERVGEEARGLVDRFPNLARHTGFVATYSFLEHQLVNFCEHIRNARKFGLSVDDVKGSGIDAAKKYLEKECKITFPHAEPEWTTIHRLREIRNAIVHRRGKLKQPEASQEVRAYIKHTPTITLDGVDRVVLSEHFCLDAIEVIRAFLIKVIASIPDETLRGEHSERGAPAIGQC